MMTMTTREERLPKHAPTAAWSSRTLTTKASFHAYELAPLFSAANDASRSLAVVEAAEPGRGSSLIGIGMAMGRWEGRSKLPCSALR